MGSIETNGNGTGFVYEVDGSHRESRKLLPGVSITVADGERIELHTIRDRGDGQLFLSGMERLAAQSVVVLEIVKAEADIR